MSFLSSIADPHSIITPIESGIFFPEKMELMLTKYSRQIDLFKTLVQTSSSSAHLLSRIRSAEVDAEDRMSQLKIFRRCVCLVCDTEMTKKITKVPTSVLVQNYGDMFKPIESLKKDFQDMSRDRTAALAMLIGEYDDRGQIGYRLTDLFFSWFENHFPDLTIEGPRGAGRDIELSSILKDFPDNFPCDFVVKTNKRLVAVGFARYDSTRGGAQSDDRTGGNEAKVYKAKQYHADTGRKFRLIFLADGPGLLHRDTWQAACSLDAAWEDNVRVTTLRTAEKRITRHWLTGT
jgi:hypothetical protein